MSSPERRPSTSSTQQDSQFYVQFHLPSQDGYDSDETDAVAVLERLSSDALPIFSGETEACRCMKVLCFKAHSDGRRGELGTLVCTNFRLCFQSMEQDVQTPCCSRSLFSSHQLDVTLACIDQIDYSPPATHASGDTLKKYRPMIVPFQSSDRDAVSAIKIFTKDFRVLEYDFRLSQHSVQMVNQIFHFVFKSSAGRLFRPKFPTQASRQSAATAENRGASALCYDRLLLQRELHRTGAAFHGWRLMTANETFAIAPSYGRAVVVPMELTDADVVRGATGFQQCRFPVWCWTDPTAPHGSAPSLVRASATVKQHLFANELLKTYRSILSSGRRPSARADLAAAGRQPTGPPLCSVVNLDSELSAGVYWVARVADSFSKLRKLADIHTVAKFESTDKDWLTRLSDTGWPQLVVEIMHAARNVVASLARGQSVLVQERVSTDAAAVVCSVAQLCLDPYYRTTSGFGVLFDKEWSHAGHPFASRLHGVSGGGSAAPLGAQRPVDLQRALSPVATDDWLLSGAVHQHKFRMRRTESNTSLAVSAKNALHTAAGSQQQPSAEAYSPVVLLFLDCLHQLLWMYPAEFEFTHIYLVSLWDALAAGVSDTFVADGVQAVLRMQNSNPDVSPTANTDGPDSPFPIERYYTPQHCRLFTNGLNVMRRLAGHFGMLPTTVDDFADNESRLFCGTECDWGDLGRRGTLQPPQSLGAYRFWADLVPVPDPVKRPVKCQMSCKGSGTAPQYLRWSPAAQLLNGGDIQRRLLVNAMAGELCALLKQSVARSSGDASLLQTVLAESSLPRPGAERRQSSGHHPFVAGGSPGVITSAFPYSSDWVSPADAPLPARTAGSPRLPSNFQRRSISEAQHLRDDISTNNLTIESLCAFYTDAPKYSKWPLPKKPPKPPATSTTRPAPGGGYQRMRSYEPPDAAAQQLQQQLQQLQFMTPQRQQRTQPQRCPSDAMGRNTPV